jgi:hypothetical protein
MLKSSVEALRRVDRSVGIALVFAFAFGAAAGAMVPHTGKSVGSSLPLHAALPLQLEAASLVMPIVHPESLVVHADPIDLTPLLQQQAMQKQFAEERCLAEAMYYEARGEGEAGERAIAEVVFHRTKARGYPHSLCGVVYQGVGSGHGCQFSFACNGEMLQARNAGAWTRAKRLAARILSGVEQLGNQTADAISFHAVDVEPGWDDHLVRTIQIGNHIFYRPAFRSHSS